MKKIDDNHQQSHLALVEDDDAIRELLTINLQKEGFIVDSFFSVEQLERKNEGMFYDLLLLDIMLPGENGLAYAQKLRNRGVNVPILFISALGQEDKIKTAYSAGAIDYIIKPFEVDNLLAKVKNLAYYFVKRHSAPLPQKIGRARINWSLLQVETDSENHLLTPKEAKVLIHFVENPNKIINRKELIETVWGDDVYVTSRNIDNFLVKFRKWFEEDPSNPRLFITYSKKGYAYKTLQDL
jgi:DNA-binding response OmpR family regulator